jgi:dipeptidyl-peptidase-4
MLLHELAHSYHHRVLGYENWEIKAAFKEAVASKTYESVLNVRGQKVRHYALTNEQEYFAESSEAFFGVNDFYPFVNSELKEHDPKMHELLGKLWGVSEAKPPR